MVRSDADLQAAFRAVVKAAMAAADTCVCKHRDASKVVLHKTKAMENAAFLQSVGVKVNRMLEFDEEWRTETSDGAATAMFMSAVVDLGICTLAITTEFARVVQDTGKTFLEVRSKIAVVEGREGAVPMDAVMRSILVTQAQTQFKKDRAAEAVHIAEAVMALNATK
jgi:hypothetical protein